MTLVEMLESNARKFPEKKAIIYRDSGISYRELNETVNRLALFLREEGFGKGDRIGLMIHRVPELIISFLSIAKAQCIAVPINYELFKDKINTILDTVSPGCLIVRKQFLKLARKLVHPDSNILIIVIGDEGNAGGGFSWDEIMKGKKSDNLSLEVHEDDVVYFNYTSGSTGNPKGAVTTHSNIFWNTISSVNSLKLTSDDVHLCMFAPFAHPHEIFARPLYLGGTMVLVDKIYPKTIAESISQHKVTCMMGLTPMYENLLDILEHKTYDLSSLRIPESGGMFTHAELMKRFKQKIGVSIIPVWGSTETTGIAISNIPGEEILPGSVGKPCSSYEVKIVDDHGNEVPADEIGEMIFKGPGVVQGYYKNSVDSEECFRDGWYYSDDLGRRDGKGNFYFVDRKSRMMKVAGLKVYPMEIEFFLMQHPDIKEAAVVPVKDRLRGEVPKAIVVAKNEKSLTERDIIEFCREKLPHYKVPRIVELREELPKIGSGKIDKKELMLEAL